MINLTFFFPSSLMFQASQPLCQDIIQSRWSNKISWINCSLPLLFYLILLCCYYSFPIVCFFPMISLCFLDMLFMFSLCFLRGLFMFSLCFLYVFFMFSLCFLVLFLLFPCCFHTIEAFFKSIWVISWLNTSSTLIVNCKLSFKKSNI